MIHTNKQPAPRPRGKLTAYGEIIRKNGERVEIVMEGETHLSKEELQLALQSKKQSQTTNEVK